MNFDIEIPIYCERAGKSGIFAEPINVISNLSFFIVAYLMFRYLKQNKRNDTHLYLLALSTLFIGIGSTIFHLFATSASLLPDSIPIYLTMIIFLWSFLKTTLDNKQLATALTFLFVGLQTWLYLNGFRNIGNVTMRHIVNIIGIPLLVFIAYKKYLPKAHLLIAISFIYVAAMILRAIEPAICPYFPIGTHFSWHILLSAIPYLGMILLTQQTSKIK